ncbi:MAG: hypothetical protein ACRC1H_16250, partial [Caldilineaceae bacterium]
MRSSQFSKLTGAIVTVLVLLLVLMIGLTLARFPLTATEGAAGADGSASSADATRAALAGEATASAGAAAGMLPTFTPTPGLPDTPATPAVMAGSDFGVTLQATPTRRDPAQGAEAGAAPAAGTDSVPTAEAPVATAVPTRDPSALPLPDPALPPTATVQFFANGNEVQDVAFADGSFWAATHMGALRWDVDTGAATLAGLEQGLGSVRLSSAADCPLAGFGLVFGSDAGLQIWNPDEDTWRQVVSGGAEIRHRDVSALACDVAQGLLAVGYGEH